MKTECSVCVASTLLCAWYLVYAWSDHYCNGAGGMGIRVPSLVTYINTYLLLLSPSESLNN